MSTEETRGLMPRLAAVVAFLAVCALAHTDAGARPASLPFDVEIEKGARLDTAEGRRTLTFKVELKRTGTPEDVDILWFLRGEEPFSARRQLGTVQLAADAAPTLELQAPVAGDGLYWLTVRAQGLRPGLGYSSTDRLLLSVDGSSATLLAPASLKARELLDAGLERPLPDQPDDADGPAAASKAARVEPPPGAPDAALDTFTTVEGTIKVQDANGDKHKLKNIRVEVYDSDPISPDDFLNSGTTDENGYYAISVVNDDGPFGGGIDVYIKVVTRNLNYFSVITKTPDERDNSYIWKSTTTDGVLDPTLTKNLTVSSNADAAMVWKYFMEINKATRRGFVGTAPMYAPIIYPGDGTYFDPTNVLISIDSEYSNGPDVLAHEYGHLIMYQLYSGTMPADSGGFHEIPCETAGVGLAWSEGFATAFALIARGSQDGVFHYQTGDTGLDIEHYSCSNHNMDNDELRVAAGIWDLYDSHDDNNGGNTNKGRNGNGDTNSGDERVDLTKLFQGMWGPVQHNVTDFWTDLQAVLTSAQTSKAPGIMSYDWYNAPSTSTSPTAKSESPDSG